MKRKREKNKTRTFCICIINIFSISINIILRIHKTGLSLNVSFTSFSNDDYYRHWSIERLKSIRYTIKSIRPERKNHFEFEFKSKVLDRWTKYTSIEVVFSFSLLLICWQWKRCLYRSIKKRERERMKEKMETFYFGGISITVTTPIARRF